MTARPFDLKQPRAAQSLLGAWISRPHEIRSSTCIGPGTHALNSQTVIRMGAYGLMEHTFNLLLFFPPQIAESRLSGWFASALRLVHSLHRGTELRSAL